MYSNLLHRSTIGKGKTSAGKQKRPFITPSFSCLQSFPGSLKVLIHERCLAQGTKQSTGFLNMSMRAQEQHKILHKVRVCQKRSTETQIQLLQACRYRSLGNSGEKNEGENRASISSQRNPCSKCLYDSIPYCTTSCCTAEVKTELQNV